MTTTTNTTTTPTSTHQTRQIRGAVLESCDNERPFATKPADHRVRPRTVRSRPR